MTHSELCYKVANKYNKSISLIEYKTTVCNEEPDVLIFDSYGESFLYEIKLSYSDFRNDYKKPFRIIHKVETRQKGKSFIVSTLNDSLGKYRFYVCPKGLLKLEDIPLGWGLIYYDLERDRFLTKKSSSIFKHNKGLENRLLINALRRLDRGGGSMETTIEKNITLKIKINGAKYCSNNCHLAYKNTCLLSNYMGFPDKTVFRYKDMDKNMFYRTDNCIKLCKSRNHKKNNYSFFYSIPISVFYETAYSSNSIKDAAKKLGTSESNLKWFLYSVDSIYKDKEKIKLRIDRVCAFFDGQNEARKDKIRK